MSIWKALPPVSAPATKGCKTPAFLRQQLEGFRKGAAEFIAPESTLGRLGEMNCFDPNRCRCLYYAGMEQLPRGWQLPLAIKPIFMTSSEENWSHGERQNWGDSRPKFDSGSLLTQNFGPFCGMFKLTQSNRTDAGVPTENHVRL